MHSPWTFSIQFLISVNKFMKIEHYVTLSDMVFLFSKFSQKIFFFWNKWCFMKGFYFLFRYGIVLLWDVFTSLLCFISFNLQFCYFSDNWYAVFSWYKFPCVQGFFKWHVYCAFIVIYCFYIIYSNKWYDNKQYFLSFQLEITNMFYPFILHG